MWTLNHLYFTEEIHLEDSDVHATKLLLDFWPKTTLKVLHNLTSRNWNTGQYSLIWSTHCNYLGLSLFWSGHMIWSKYCSPPWATFQQSAMWKLKMYGIESHLWTILFRMIASCMYVDFGLLCNVPWCKQGNSLDLCWLLRPLHQEQPTSVRSLLLPSQDCRLIVLPSSPFRALHHSEHSIHNSHIGIRTKKM